MIQKRYLYRIILLVALFQSFNNQSFAQKVRAVFLSRLDSLLEEPSFHPDFHDWVEEHQMNTILVYNPYVLLDSNVSSAFKLLISYNPKLKWVAIVSSVEGYKELFENENQYWSGFMLEQEWWRSEQSSITAYLIFQDRVKQCLAYKAMPHYAYIGRFSKIELFAKFQAKQLSKISDFILIHTYAKPLNTTMLARRMELLNTYESVLIPIYSLQKSYSFLEFKDQDYGSVHQKYMQKVYNELNAIYKDDGFSIFTYLDAIQD